MRDEWFFARRGPEGNRRYGPIPLPELRAMIDAGKVRGDDLVWREGMPQWQRADQCPDLSPPRPRDYPPGPRGAYDPGPAFDDRPRPPVRRRTSGTAVALIVGGVVLLVGLLAGGGGFLYYMLNYRTWAIKAAATSPLIPPQDLGNLIPYGSSYLYYTGNVNVTQASSVGSYLSKIGYLSSDHSVLVQLDSDGGETYTLRCCIDRTKAYNDDVSSGFENLRQELEDHVLYGPTNIELCDESMQPVRTFTSPNYFGPSPSMAPLFPQN